MENKQLVGGSFLIQKTSPKDVFTAEDFNEEQLGLGNVVKEFFNSFVEKHSMEKVALLNAEKDSDLILQTIREAADLGFCSVSIPEAYGGMGLDFNTNLLITEAMASGFSFATSIGCQTSIGSLPIVYYGNEEQKKKYLPGVCDFSTIASYALTEPDSGSDANSGRTRCVLSEDGKHYIMNGQKIWITNGGWAHMFIVFAKIEDDEDLSAFIVEKDFGGVTTGNEEKKYGIKASSTVQVFFDNTKIPVENLLGERGEGFKMALNILNSGRIKIGAGSIGGIKLGILNSVSYAKQRKQFKTPIADFGAIQYKIGEMVKKCYALESAVYRTGRNVDLLHDKIKAEGGTDNQAKVNSLKEFAIECSIVKVYGSEAATYAADETLQIHGGIGFVADTGAELGVRDIRITRIYEGTNEINRMLTLAEIARKGDNRGGKIPSLDLAGYGKKIPGYILKQAIPFGKSSEEWDVVENYIENLKILFITFVGTLGQDLKEKMADEQEIVMDLSDILANAYIAESCYLRYLKSKEEGKLNAEELKAQADATKLFLFDAINESRVKAQNTIYAYGKQTTKLEKVLSILLPKYKQNPVELRRDLAKYALAKDGYSMGL
ncbi:MAG: acyl-CoA dehydrogenase [Flavobacteriaceae bacterium]|nr:MAG: acyl-CoA dehydrogenase [Flavobacteriaceae bacterium]